jgi:nifR3 family TIM-barrel protein
MRLFGLDIEQRAVLAPMAGITDTPFRLAAREWGAGFTVSELVSADGLVRQSEKTYALMAFDPQERPFGIQVFGSDPSVMAEAARIAERLEPDFIDLNFGCPARKVVHRGAGAALLTDLDRLQSIARSVKAAVSVPVSAKIRSGWEEGKPVAVEAARILEAEGMDAVTVHARTRQAGFKGKADWTLIREVRQAVSITLIGNGDVSEPEDAKRMLDDTGCDFVMVGRGALGRPWIFDRIERLMKTGESVPEPSPRERIGVCLAHYALALRFRPAGKAVKEMRKHIAWYLRGMPGAAEFRSQVFTLTDPALVTEKLKAFGERFG